MWLESSTPLIGHWRTDMGESDGAGVSGAGLSRREFLLPDVGEGLTEAEVVRWHVRPGQRVEVNQPLADIETAKALVELPCPYSGVVTHLLVDVGVVVPVGTSIAAFDVNDAAGVASDGREPLLVGYGTSSQAPPRRRRRSPERSVGSVSGVKAKPPVRQLARRLGVDLTLIAPTGAGGVVTRDDVARASAGRGSQTQQPVPSLPGDVRTAATSVQRAMAQAMTQSALVPQATVWRDIDFTNGQNYLAALRAKTEFGELRLTPLTLVCHAVVLAMAEHPDVAALWDASTSEVVQRAEVRVGIAVATERGLLVPHFASSECSSLTALARVVTELTTAARDGRTSPEQLAPGAITVTNVGVFGVDGGTPLLYPGESSILAMGRVNERPWVVDGQLQVRSVMRLSLTFDHRHIDGALAAKVLGSIADYLDGV